jgi:predicted PhzF superfamily epimerase YddE/YHI9
MTPPILRYAAFTDTPAGGDPAGAALEAGGVGDAARREGRAGVDVTGRAVVIDAGVV